MEYVDKNRKCPTCKGYVKFNVDEDEWICIDCGLKLKDKDVERIELAKKSRR